ncbi:MAG: arginine--tRNA ligase [Acidimicrobiia bacterium]|nr:arginine--tRNA ligase [Acidimicrobiia bacterium]
MSIQTDLTSRVAGAFAAIGLEPALGEVVPSQRPELAQFQCNGALAAASAAGRSPREIAQDVIDHLGTDPVFAELAVAGPGFINITVTDDFLAGSMNAMGASERLGVEPGPGGRTIIDYGGPNVAKELHVGHLRTAIIGESMKRCLRFAGHDVIGDVHLGDWGLQMGQLIAEMERRRPDLPYFDRAYTGPYPDESPVTVDELNDLYPHAAAHSEEDPEFASAARQATFELQDGHRGYRALWEHFRAVSVAAMKEVYSDLGVQFERWYGESTVHHRMGPMVQALQDRGVATEVDGAILVDVSLPDDNKEIPPFVVVKSDGAYLYTTTDLATIADRAEDGFTDCIYVVDVRQSDHFEQLFRAARKGKIAPESMILEHAGNGLVNGPDGRPLKTRAGNLPLLRSLIADAIALAEERMRERNFAEGYPEAERAAVARLVGLAALKYGDLQNHRTSNYIFDLERFTSFEGKTGPYLLYGAVRMQSILRETAARGMEPGPIVAPANEHDRNLTLRLLRFPEVLGRAIEHRAPNQIAEHAYDVVADFNRFYEACRIVDQPDAHIRGSWLRLVEAAHRQLATLLDLLVIAIPERM